MPTRAEKVANDGVSELVFDNLVESSRVILITLARFTTERLYLLRHSRFSQELPAIFSESGSNPYVVDTA